MTFQELRQNLLDTVFDANGVSSFEEVYDVMEDADARDFVIQAEDAAHDLLSDISPTEITEILHERQMWDDLLYTAVSTYRGPEMKDWLVEYLADMLLSSLEAGTPAEDLDQ